MTPNRKWIPPLELEGRWVVLSPLGMEHLEGLQEATRDGELWRLWYTTVPSPETAPKYITDALRAREHEGAMPFVVKDRKSGTILGSTRMFDVDEQNRRLEIGYTWYSKRAQRSAVNTECKLLLLTLAFEELRTVAVEFRTHWANRASRAAIERLGARQDGVLRNHRIMPDGTYRDTVVYSITESEWPAVKSGLKFRLDL